MNNTIVLSDRETLEKEAKLDSSDTPILPGMLITLSSGRAVPGTLTTGRLLVAIEQPFTGKGVDDEYSVTDEVVEYTNLLPGDRFISRLKAGHSVADGTLLAVDGAGGVQPTTDTSEAFAIALETVNNTTDGYVKLRTRVLGSGVASVTLNPPAFDTAEVGAVAATIVVVTFTQNVVATNYATGVTIKKGGVSQTISAAARQTNHKIVRYTIPAVANGATVTWEYSATTGHILAESDDSPLPTTTAQSVTNNVP